MVLQTNLGVYAGFSDQCAITIVQEAKIRSDHHCSLNCRLDRPTEPIVLGHNAVSSTGGISDYDTYRRQVNTFTQKGLDEAEAPDAVVATITKLIGAKQPKFSNPVGKMTGIILFLQSYAHKMFESSVLKSVRTAS